MKWFQWRKLFDLSRVAESVRYCMWVCIFSANCSAPSLPRDERQSKYGVYVVGNSKGDCQQNSCVIFHYHLACPPTLIW